MSTPPTSIFEHTRRGLLVIVWMQGILPLPIYATDFSWNNASGGRFHVASNWSPAGGPPNDIFDTATFSLLAVYDVEFWANFTNRNIIVDTGTITLDHFNEDGFDGPISHNYTLSPPIGTPAASIGSVPNALFPATLIVSGFSTPEGVIANGVVEIGAEANSAGVLTIGSATWTGTSTTYVGRNGDGTLRVFQPMENFNGVIASGSGSTGDAQIHHVWTNNGSLTVGGSGNATMLIEGFDSLVTCTDAFVAAQAGSVSSVTLNQSGDWQPSGSLYVGGTAVAAGGSATIELVDDFFSSVITAAGTIHLWPNGIINFNRGQITANNLTGTGALNWAAGALEITGGELIIDSTTPFGASEDLNASKWLSVAGSLKVSQDGPGVLNIQVGGKVDSAEGIIGNDSLAVGLGSVHVSGDGANWTITNDLRIGGRDPATFVVEDTATVSNVNCNVAVDPLSSANVTIDNATWTNASSVYLGGNAAGTGGTGTATVQNNGVIDAGSIVKVWDHYTLTINGGSVQTPILNVAGTVNVSGILDVSGSDSIGMLQLNGGTVNADAIDFGAESFSGFGAVNGEVIVGGDVIATGELTLGDAESFNGVLIGGNLNVGSQTVTIQNNGFFAIGTSTLLSGGTLNAPNGIAIPVGAGLAARGTINGRIAQHAGSTINATNDLVLGDDESPAGFLSDGEMSVGGRHRITLRDANEAVLGSLTALGEEESAGALAAANGAVLEFGKNIVGFGDVETPDDPTMPFINNGSIVGRSPEQPITMTGYVKGVGFLDNVDITGTDAPGFSVATVHRGSVSYLGRLEIEIGAIDQYDRIIHTGTAGLGGTLAVKLIDNFTANVGDRFTVIRAESFNGTFNEMIWPVAPTGSFWHGAIETSSNDSTYVVSLCTGQGDIDLDCAVTLADLAGFADCMSGPGNAPNPNPPLTINQCLNAFDADNDGDVDLTDGAAHQSRYR